MNGAVFDKWFPTKYLWLWLLHHPFALLELYITTLSSIRYFNWQKNWVAFSFEELANYARLSIREVPVEYCKQETWDGEL